MEGLLDITSQPAQTPHEKWFQEAYGKTIEATMEALRNPVNPSNPSLSWQQFKQVRYFSILARMNRNYSSYGSNQTS